MTFALSAEFPHEAAIRLGVFALVLATMAIAESLAPRRNRSFDRIIRWPANFAMTIIGTLLIRLLIPVTAVAAAIIAARHSAGLLNMIAMPIPLAFVLGVLALDLAIYLQHIMFHAVPALWRLHRMHHADLDFDVTTGVRFHPGEIVLSMLIKIAVVLALGISPAAVLTFEVLLNATSMFNHTNLAIPESLDRWLRWLLVTPDMHRVHHSIVRDETNSNFGFNLPWWDRLLGTYRAQPAAGHLAMTIGIDQFRDGNELGLIKMLVQPLRNPLGTYPINRSAP
jgi:sterol desaturase/sphingolipid hydroxylase (fatty acid hydroxylase superfamily)